MKERDYNSFGMKFENSNNKYLYNDKELIDQAGLECYDYGARFYDASLGRFVCLDPAADNFAFVSPYNYAENSPIANIDLWGLQAWPANNKEDEAMSHEGYKEHVESKSEEMVNAEDKEENQYDCADFCITILVSYYKEKGVQFKYKIGKKTLDSNDPKYSGETAYEDFIEDVKLATSADNLRKSNISKPIKEKNLEKGDLINSGGHTQIFLENDENSETPIKSVQASGNYFGKGNADNSVKLPKKVSYRRVWAKSYRWTFLNRVPKTDEDANKIKLAREFWGD